MSDLREQNKRFRALLERANESMADVRMFPLLRSEIRMALQEPMPSEQIKTEDTTTEGKD